MWIIISVILSISLLISIGTNNMLRKKIETLEYSIDCL
ncbi:DUF1514 family protein, partial [Staphylococcus pseudintermedius]|nr:DUF1514 family protein [Staphylococcus pseudintermedius]